MTEGFLPVESLATLIDALHADGRTIVAPVKQGNAVSLGVVESVEDLPAGWGDKQDAGNYRLWQRGDRALFGTNLGHTGWKRFLHPPELPLLRIQRTEGGIRFTEPVRDLPQWAFLGVRACELRGIETLMRVVAGGVFPDPDSAARRANAFLIAVECAQSAATCFCDSIGTGPEAQSGYDIAMAEIFPGTIGHGFLVHAGSPQGIAVVERLPLEPATDDQRAERKAALDRSRAGQSRRLDTDGLREMLQDAAQDSHWQTLEDRCLACGNCTQVCPTCFCTDIHDTTDLAGTTAERTRVADSCFHFDFSRVHGAPVRSSIAARYRHWMTHKLSTWHDQFGESGCVGCGRCITWCPVGIDIVAEAAALRAKRKSQSS